MIVYAPHQYWDDWNIYLHARQLYIETGDLDALDNMVAHVTEHDGVIPDNPEPIAWQTPMVDVNRVSHNDLECY
jgi:hypothetical protein